MTFNLAFIAGRFDADRTAFAAYCLDVVTRANAWERDVDLKALVKEVLTQVKN